MRNRVVVMRTRLAARMSPRRAHLRPNLTTRRSQRRRRLKSPMPSLTAKTRRSRTMLKRRSKKLLQAHKSPRRT
jgi:hypothetical protein